MAANDVARSLLGRFPRHHHLRVLRAIEGRTQHIGHAGVELDECVALRRPGLHNVVHKADERARVGREVGAGLDLEVQLAAVLGGEFLKDILDHRAVRLEVGALVGLHARHLVAAAEVEDRDIRELFAERDGHASRLAPHGRIRARAFLIAR
jgi:hypothetical protein